MFITRLLFTLLLCCILLFKSSATLDIRVVLNSTDNKPLTNSQMQSLRSLKLKIDGNPQYIYPESSASNIFKIPSYLGGGLHIYELVSNQYIFPVLVIDQRVQGLPKMKWLNPYDRKMIKIVKQPTMTPLEKIKYFEPESGINIMGFLAGGNGLFMLMGLSMLICYKGLGKLGEAQMAPQPPQVQRKD